MSYLASPELDGRGNGSEGLAKARDYITGQFEEVGLVPAGDDGYLSAFSAVTRSKPSRDVGLAIGEHVLAPGVEFSPAAISDDASFDAEAVFVGYGLSAPALGYDDYAGIDVRGNVVIALSGAPAAYRSALDADGSGYLLSANSKAAVALSMGARAIFLVNDPRNHGDKADQEADQLPQLRPASALQGISVGHLTEKAARRALTSVGVDLAELQREIDESGAPQSRSLGLQIAGNLSLERESSTLYNIQGILEGANSEASEPIVITAHYDGLGFGHAGSLSESDPVIHPGADDNASGVAVLIELARALAEHPPEDRPPIIFAAPAGEELGLQGSRRLARALADQYAGGTAINFDMLGRLRDRQLQVAHDADDQHLSDLIARSADESNVSAQTEALDARFSDHISFVELGFQGLSITTGRHGAYHMPDDTLDKINWKGLSAAHTFAENLVRGLSRPD